MKKVMASGTFDLLHPGHGVYLEETTQNFMLLLHATQPLKREKECR